jgi:hypothetical protein
MLSYFGMVAMILDGMRAQAEKLEDQVRTLEGILPICSYCKKSAMRGITGSVLRST